MTVRECYEIMGADYEDVVSRLMKEENVKKFAVKFLNDKSYEWLAKSIADENYKEAFEAAHTLKGVSQNLGFTSLFKASEAMTENLRAGKNEEAGDLMPAVNEAYEKTIEAVKRLEAAG